MEYHQSITMIIPAGRAAAGWWAATWATPTAGCGTAARRRRAPGGPRCCPRAGRCGPGSRGASSAGSRTPWPWSPSEVSCRHVSDGWLGFEYNTPFKNLLLHWSRSVNKFIVIFMIFANQTANWHVAEFHMETTCLSKHRDGKKHYKTSLN